VKRPLGIWLLTVFGLLMAAAHGAGFYWQWQINKALNDSNVPSLQLPATFQLATWLTFLVSLSFTYFVWNQKKISIAFLSLFAIAPFLPYAVPFFRQKSAYHDTYYIVPRGIWIWVLIITLSLAYLIWAKRSGNLS
jgi:hypothetical protein